MKTIVSDTYNVYIGKDVFNQINDYLASNNYSKIFILVDENTMQFCLTELIARVEKLKKAEIIETESGEENKTIDICIQMWKALTELKADRKSLIVNLGGGVLSDLGGFAASTFKRGMDYINIPTTLLAQVDASIGGKTGLDLDNFKNQVGLFSNPKAVFIYPPYLNTLSKKQILSGFAEVIKHALIADENYWNQIKNFKPANPDWEGIIYSSVVIKNNIVLKDPHEKNIRKSLNFGHTIGHAIETFFLESELQPLLHGEAVAAGIFCEAFLSYKKAGLEHTQLDEICDFLLKFYKPVNFNQVIPQRLIEIMEQDKKNENGQIMFTLISKTGNAVVNNKCSTELISESFNFYQMRAAMVASDL
ncbi:MAG: 3-dehydroquinate synthase [Bacteroidetes bacterium]|nr:3-dehydroquinate synthase [Bacteroidota bacterium]HET6243009.1 3-dehydroquinate synthase [Bacteroidia bacterium]